jgi:hypothetical protein
MNLKAEQNHALSFFLKAIQTNNGTKKELFSGKNPQNCGGWMKEQ